MNEQEENALKRLALLCLDYHIKIVGDVETGDFKVLSRDSTIFEGSTEDLLRKYTLSEI